MKRIRTFNIQRFSERLDVLKKKTQKAQKQHTMSIQLAQLYIETDRYWGNLQITRSPVFLHRCIGQQLDVVFPRLPTFRHCIETGDIPDKRQRVTEKKVNGLLFGYCVSRYVCLAINQIKITGHGSSQEIVPTDHEKPKLAWSSR